MTHIAAHQSSGSRKTIALPTGPIDQDPSDTYQGHSPKEVRALPDTAVDGTDLGAYDRRIIEWIRRLDQPTILVIASLINRARERPADTP